MTNYLYGNSLFTLNNIDNDVLRYSSQFLLKLYTFHVKNNEEEDKSQRLMELTSGGIRKQNERGYLSFVFYICPSIPIIIIKYITSLTIVQPSIIFKFGASLQN